MEILKVVYISSFASIQDMGRRGYKRYGIPSSGFLDPLAAVNTNIACGNPPGSALIEFYYQSPVFKIIHPCRVAVGGVRSVAMVNEIRQKSSTLVLEKDDIFKVHLEKGLVGYISLYGGIKCKTAFNSHSYHSQIGLGGFRLEKDMIIVGNNKVESPNFTSSKILAPDYSNSRIEVNSGPEFYLLSEHQKEIFLNQSYIIRSDSNRMSIICDASHWVHIEYSMISVPVFPGTVQLPPSGKPVILLQDCQVSGGYPRVLVIKSSSLPVLVQKKPGESFHFQFRG